ncbi:serine hydrolase domain-containing protein [Cohnella soli]|uniref:Serine hydrolase domain-containing protein n=1 Tax=Cohnella soli TaxID=425005 RepID=A0ABW0HSM5_9BACL
MSCPYAVVEYVERLMQEKVTPCYSLAVAYRGKTYEAYGGTVLTSDGTKVVAGPDVPFNVGSVTKIITSSLAVKLAEKGLISLDDPVSKYVPAYRYPHTILQLMLHTAGFAPPESLQWPANEQLDSYKQRIYDHPVSEVADRSAVYYTQGYTILMDILEIASGSSLGDLGSRYIFEPMEMSNTTIETSGWMPGTYTLPYDNGNNGPVNELEGLAVTGDSGLYSTAADLLRFGRMLLADGRYEGKQLFSEAAAKLLKREVTNHRFNKTPAMWVKGERDLYGCFGDFMTPSAMGHPGFSGCMLAIDPGFDFVGAFVTNSQKIHADWSYYRKLWNVAISGSDRV